VNFRLVRARGRHEDDLREPDMGPAGVIVIDKSIWGERKGRCPAPPYSEGTLDPGGADATRFARVPQK